MLRLSAAERQRRWRSKNRKSQMTCPHCGGWIWGSIATQIGFHQRCDKAGYIREYRRIKKGEPRNES